MTLLIYNIIRLWHVFLAQHKLVKIVKLKKNQNPIFFSQTHSAYLQTAAVVCYEYNRFVTMETTQVALDT